MHWKPPVMLEAFDATSVHCIKLAVMLDAYGAM
jgi:hypothetical protein